MTPEVDEYGIPVRKARKNDVVDDYGIPIRKPEEIKKKEALSFPSLNIWGKSGSGGQSTGRVPEAPKYANTEKEKTFQFPKVAKDPKQDALNQINDAFSNPENADDPIGGAIKSGGDINYGKSGEHFDEGKHKVDVFIEKLKVLNNAFEKGDDAKQYLERTTGLPIGNIPTEEIKKLAGNNYTKQAAVARLDKARKVEAALDRGKRTLEEAAIDYAIANGDEQAAYLKEKGSYMGIPPSMKGEKLMQFLLTPDLHDLGEKNPELKQQIRNELANLPNHHPEYATKILAQAIADRRDKQGYNNWFANVVGKETTDKMVDEMIEEGVLPVNYKFLYEKEIRPKLGTWKSIGRGIGNTIPGVNQLVNEAPIPTPGALENIQEGFENFQVGTAKSIANLTGIQGLIQPKAQQVYNTLEKEYSTPAFEPSSLLHKTSMHGGQLAGFIPGLVGGTGALKAINAFKNPAVASGAMFVLATHGDNMEKAKTLFPKNDMKQVLYTGTMDIANGVMGRFLPGQQIPKLLSKAEPTIVDALKGMVDGKITTDAAKSTITNAIGNAIKGTVHGAEFMGAIAGIDDLTTQLLQGKGIDFSQTMDKTWDSFKTGLLATLPLATFEAALKSNKGLRNEIVSMAANPEHYKDILNKEAESNPELAKVKDDIISNLDHISKVYSESKLPQKEKESFVINSLTEKIKLNQAENATDPTIKKRLQKEAKDIGEIKEASLNGVPEEKVRMNQVAKEVKEFYNNGYLSKVANEMLETKKTEESEGKFDEAKVESFLKEVASNPKKQVPARIRELAEDMFPPEEKIETEADIKAPEEQQVSATQPKENTIRQRYIDDFNIVEDSSFDWRVKSELSTADRKKAVDDIKSGKDTAAARKLEQEIKDTQERGTVIINRGRGNNAQTVEIPIDEWFELTPQEHENVFQTADKMDDLTTSIISENDITLQNIDSLKHLFNGFPYDKEQFEQVKTYLSGQGERISKTSKVSEGRNIEETQTINETPQETAQSVKSVSPETQSLTTGTTPEVIEPAKEATAEQEPPISEPPNGRRIYVERPSTELSHRGLQNVANEFSLEDVQVRDRKSDLQLMKDAETTVNDWAEKGVYGKNVERLVKKAEGGEVLTDEQRVILEGHLANISQDLREISDKSSPEWEQKFQEVKRLKEAGEKTRSEAGAALRIPGGGSRPHPITDYGDAMVAMAEATGKETLTEQQKQEVEKLVNNYEQKAKMAEDKLADVEARFAALQAQKEVKKTATTTKRVKKDYTEERKKIFEDIREKLKKARQETSATILPYAKELIAIAPDVAKLVKSYVGEGITEFSEVVKKVHEFVRDLVPEAKEEDIVDVIAGKYNQPKETKGDLKAKLKSIKDKNSAEAIKIRAKIKSGDFEKREIPTSWANNPEFKKEFPKEHKEALDALSEKEQAKLDYDIALYKAERAKRSTVRKGIDLGRSLIATTKAIKSGIDDSAVMMQNIVAMASHPRSGIKALKEHALDAVSEKRFRRYLTELHESPIWDLIEKSGLDITDPKSLKEQNKEEIFDNNLLNKDIVIKGKKYNVGKYLTRPFERAFTSLGNAMRVNMFTRIAQRMVDEGKTFESHPQEFKDLARVLNTETGRGKLHTQVERASQLVTAGIWSPRLMASRLNMLGLSEIAPLYGGKGYYAGLTPEARKMALLDVAKFIGAGAAFMAFAGYNGAQIDTDPESPTFGTIQVGDKKYNAWGGFTPYVKTIYQGITGHRNINGVRKPITRSELLGKFFRSRLTPAAGVTTDILTGKDYSGKEVTPLGELQGLALPLSINSVIEAVKKDGALGILTEGVPSFVGVGVSDERDFQKKEDSSKKSTSRKPTKQHKAD